MEGQEHYSRGGGRGRNTTVEEAEGAGTLQYCRGGGGRGRNTAEEEEGEAGTLKFSYKIIDMLLNTFLQSV
jgi:hypothetical protein